MTKLILKAGQPRSRLCLNMIVRNEADRIERCLRSVAPFIECYVIVDTGSTDGTPQKIKEILGTIPGEIHHAPFVNFSQARNAALTAARASKLEFDYLLLTDADMELHVDQPDVLANGLTAPAYAVLQKAGTLAYWNTRLLARYRDGNYVGATHEYLDVGDCTPLDGVWFYDHADGSNRKDKFERDVALLLAEAKEQPDNPRTWFYLGQSYRDAGQPEKALEAYEKRIALGGWAEEVFVSKTNVACCYKDMGNEAEFIRNILDAYDYRPTRAEPLYDLAKHYREKGQNTLATMLARRGMAMSYPKDMLFVSDYAHKFGCREEYSIAAFYDDDLRPQGFRVCDSLALDRDAPHCTRDLARNNLFHYIKPLTDYLPMETFEIPFAPPEGYVAMNPSILATVDGTFLVNVRTVNYTISDSGHYLIRGGDGSITNDNPINTRNFIVTLDKDFQRLDSAELMWSRPPAVYPLVTGLEDVRIFQAYTNKGFGLHAYANIREANADGWCEQHLLDIHLTDEGANVIAWGAIRPEPRQHEKNWMPCPTRLAKQVGTATPAMYRLGELVWPDGTIEKLKNPFSSETLSGGGQVVPTGIIGPHANLHIAIVHEARPHPHHWGQRYYNHRFVLFDAQLNVLKISKPFVFQDKQIEFAAGLCLDHGHIMDRPGRLTVSYGVRDSSAWLATMGLDDVMEFINA